MHYQSFSPFHFVFEQVKYYYESECSRSNLFDEHHNWDNFVETRAKDSASRQTGKKQV